MFGRSSPHPEPIRPVEPAPPHSPAAPTAGFMPAHGGAPSGQPRPPATGAAGSMTTSVIGKDLRIAGDKIIIVCQSRLQVDGEIVGDLAGREVVIGETASVTGSVSAESIEVRGRVDGAIKGQSVALLPSAKVEGDILHQVLTIAEGAQFDGRVKRAKDVSEVSPVLELPKVG